MGVERVTAPINTVPYPHCACLLSLTKGTTAQTGKYFILQVQQGRNTCLIRVSLTTEESCASTAHHYSIRRSEGNEEHAEDVILVKVWQVAMQGLYDSIIDVDLESPSAGQMPRPRARMMSVEFLSRCIWPCASFHSRKGDRFIYCHTHTVSE